MEDGKRLENLSWRLWNRETFCCQPDSKARARLLSASSVPAAAARPRTATSDTSLPRLSSSLDSLSSEEEDDDDDEGDDVTQRRDDATTSPATADDPSSSTHLPQARPELRQHLADEHSNHPCEKHITPIDLEKIVISIKETQAIEPIDLPMPMPVSCSRSAPASASHTSASPRLAALHLSEPEKSQDAHSQASTPPPSSSHATLLESSASTVDTNDSKSSHTVSSDDSSSTEMSTHSIVRGFVPGGAPSSYRSQTNLAAQPTPILKTSSHYQAAQPKKKGPMFTIGTSSGEDESSLDSHMYKPSISKSSLSESLKRSADGRGGDVKKQTSFKDEIAVARAAAARHSPVFESDDEDDDVSESAIEDEDDSSEWEDSDDNNSGPSSVNERELFQRVDSRPDLTSRRSLLTTLMHEPDRAKALANAASRSSPAIRRSRAMSPNGPSVAASPEPGLELHLPRHEGSHPQPIIMTTSNTHQQLALSPRTTRRNMLSTELTESLRKNLLWERQHKSTGNLAALKRRHTAHDVKNLKQHPDAPYPTKNATNMSYNNDYFDAGLGEYHARGW